ncbi:uncharacterized protein FOMMEDRAFT_141374 [Fomitiporia mediterranea MF3/22]|uniref:uncharacterized protein n=1 Tax=Fomitiporia mediterranea (strain MF3/22) TaxID=694068 RepID=UPI00044098A2|nr:uncharacterized protein FOMMEDRAFT_141374 [Fomitiporia mediterranea MF3/22]EJD02267.1 hypothetical protein FOMMEDRAFT_141374 [Fomitiporia mediterranea MF3/22]
MDSPRQRTRRSTKRTSRQPSPERIRVRSKPASSAQPEAGPSRKQPRLSNPLAQTQLANFSSGADFIAFEGEDDDRPRRSTREWDKGKTERNWDRDGHAAGRKRRWEESDRDDASSLRHAGSKRSTHRLRRTPWTDYVDWDSCRNVAELMHKEVEAYLKYVSPTPVEHEVRWMVVQLISSSIKRVYSDSEVLPFGSFGTKLYLPQGDIDLVVQSRTLASFEKVTALKSLANIVKRTGLADKVTIISQARVPIIKFTTLYGRFAVDISMNQSNGVKTGDMINRFLNEFPALRAIVLIVKSFLKQRNLNEVYSGGLGSYAIVCLAVSHLQMHPKVRRAEINSAKNLGVLTLEFFELYGKYFNYNNTGISLRHGGSYFGKQERGWRDYNKPYLLCIEDPGDISNDISRGSYGIKRVKQTFAGAYDMMLSSIYLVAQILSARQDSRDVDLRKGSMLERGGDELSVLSAILGINQETINHRRLVREVHEEGELARMLGVEPRVGLPGGKTRGREKEAESVVEAWEEAESMSESDEDGVDHQMDVNALNGRLQDDRESENESRYRIKAKQNGKHRSSRSASASDGPSSRRQAGPSRVAKRSRIDTAYFVADEDSESHATTEQFDRDEPIRSYVDPNVDSTAAGSGDDDDDDGLDEIERAYIAAADAFADDAHQLDDEYDSGPAFTEEATGSKGKGKEKSINGRMNLKRSLSGDERRAFWASKSVLGGDLSEFEEDLEWG